MITTDHLFGRVLLTADIGAHRAGDEGVLVHLDDDGFGVVEFEDGRWLQTIAVDEAEPAAPARPTTPAA